MAGKLHWLTEQQLGDTIWDRKTEFFGHNEKEKWFREMKIGRGYVDFARFTSAAVELFELKITASIHSVYQLSKYKSDLEGLVMKTFWFGPEKKIIEGDPEIMSHLIARFVDNDIVHFCNHIGICLWKIDVANNGDVNGIDLISDDNEKYNVQDRPLAMELLNHFAVKQ
ncbi:MAG: hypothetical protein H0X02_06720 [Nitrosomonas sp.]|nr:hypothetical protein [Nitrosomonas sp.]